MGYEVTYRGRAFAVGVGQVFDPAVADLAIGDEAAAPAPVADTPRNEPAGTTLDGYQAQALETATFPGRGEGQIIYPAVALAGEAGEMALEVLTLLNLQSRRMAGDYNIAVQALAAVAAGGAVMELLKKVYRNDPPGELTAERKDVLLAANAAAGAAFGELGRSIQLGARVEFPPVPLEDSDKKPLVREIGDALWYVACICTEARVSLGYVAYINYAKLADRARRDALRSTGDNR